jgi:predicted GNAT family N-acyltransferase
MKLNIRKVNNSSDFFKLLEVRKKVYVDELNVPIELEFDEYDETAFHFVVEVDDIVVGTARLVALDNEGNIGRVCILKDFRRKGLGTKLITSIINASMNMGLDRLTVEAKVDALPFYEKMGFVNEGNEYLEIGVPHNKMFLILEKSGNRVKL